MYIQFCCPNASLGSSQSWPQISLLTSAVGQCHLVLRSHDLGITIIQKQKVNLYEVSLANHPVNPFPSIPTVS